MLFANWSDYFVSIYIASVEKTAKVKVDVIILLEANI